MSLADTMQEAAYTEAQIEALWHIREELEKLNRVLERIADRLEREEG